MRSTRATSQRFHTSARRHTALAASVAMLLAAAPVFGALTWDADLAQAGTQNGNGKWDAGNNWWNGTTNAGWVAGEDAIFGTSTGLGTWNVDVSGMTVGNVTFDFANKYTLTSSTGSLNLAGVGGTHSFINVGPLSGTLLGAVAANIAGSGNVSVGNPGGAIQGYVEFSGNNSYTGSTTVNAILQISGGNAIPDGSVVTMGTNSILLVKGNETIGGLSGAGTVSLYDAFALTFGGNNQDSVFTSNLSGGSGNVAVKVGTGTVEMSPTHFTVPVLVKQGTVVAGVSALSGTSITGTMTVEAPATLRLSGALDLAGLSGAGSVVLGSNTLSVGSGDFSGQIGGTGSLKKIQPGTLTLSGANSFSGGVTITDGTLAVTDAGALGTGPITLSPAAAIPFPFTPAGSPVLAFSGGSFTENRNISAVTGTSRIAVTDAGATITLGGQVAGAGALTVSGAGTLVLTNPANSFSGVLTIDGGTLSAGGVANSGASSVAGAGTGFSFSNGGHLLFTGPTSSTNRSVTLAAPASSNTAGTIEIQQGSTTLSLSSAITGTGVLIKTGPGTLALSAGTSSSTNLWIKEGMVIATGNAELKSGVELKGGGLTLADNSRISGGLWLYNQSTFTAARTSAFAATSGVFVDGDSTFSLGADLSLQALVGSGTVNLGTNALTIGTNNGNGTFTGTLTGSGTVIKMGNGYTGLSNASTRTGGTTILSGGLTVSDFSALGAGTVQVGSSQFQGTLGYSGPSTSAAHPITLGSFGGILAVATVGTTLTFGGLISGTGGLTITSGTDAGGVALTNPGNNFTGPFSIGQGRLLIADVPDAGVASPIGKGPITFKVGSQLVYTGSGNDSSDRQLIFENEGVVEVPAGVTLTLPNATESGPIAGGLTKRGAGTLVQTNQANNYSRSVVIQGGTLVTGALTDAGVPSGIGRGSGISLTEYPAGSVGQLALLTGAGGSTNRQIFVGRVVAGGSGGGIISIDAAQLTLTGQLTINAPLTLRGTSAQTSTFVLANPSNSVLDGDLTIENVKVRATNGNNLPDAKRVTLVANSAAWLSIEAPETIGSLAGGEGATPGRISLGAAVTVGGDNSSSTFSGTIDGTGALTKTGTGTLRLAGLNSATGGVSVVGGTLQIEGDISGAVTVNGPGKLESIGARTIGNLTIPGGTVGPGGAGAASVLHTGKFALNGGTLSVDLMSADPSGYDTISVTGDVTLAGAIGTAIRLGYDPVDFVDTFTLLANDGTDPIALGIPAPTLGGEFLVSSGGYTQLFKLQIGGTDGNDLMLVAIPEPSSAVLIFGGTLMLAVRRRKKAD